MAIDVDVSDGRSTLMESVAQLFSSLSARGKRVFFQPNTGNAGDSLINLGTLRLLRANSLPFTLVRDDFAYEELTPDDILLLPGGGYLVPYWNPSNRILNAIRFSGCRVVLLPQSIRSAPEALSALKPTDVVYAREKPTYSFVKNLGLQAEIRLDHDMAFHLGSLQPRFPKLSFPRHRKEAARYALLAHHRIRSSLRRELRAFRTDSEKLRSGSASIANDISLICKFGHNSEAEIERSVDALLWALSLYDHVWTDRLHVMIARLLLRSPVSVVDNAYRKLGSVFEFSIAADPELSNLVHWRDRL